VIHAGQPADPQTGAVITPIYATSTYAQESPGKHKGLDYGRSHNPTRWAYERCVADLEGATTASRSLPAWPATSTVLELLDSGAHVVALDDLYGGTRRVFERVRRARRSQIHLHGPRVARSAPRGAHARDEDDLGGDALQSAAEARGLAMVAQVAKSRCIIAVADNTFASPWVQRPIEHGFDIVVHSATKYLNGHSDVVNGVAVTARETSPRSSASCRTPSARCRARSTRSSSRAASRRSRFAWSAIARSALAIARWLEKHPKIEKVFYPGSRATRSTRSPKRRCRRFGGMVSAIVKGGETAALRFLERCQIFTLAESLGGVESLIEHPGS
jgi:cystathionine beta-lyase/cystathionine gamma-synthase